MAVCRKELMDAGKPYPKSCPTCGHSKACSKELHKPRIDQREVDLKQRIVNLLKALNASPDNVTPDMVWEIFLSGHSCFKQGIGIPPESIYKIIEETFYNCGMKNHKLKVLEDHKKAEQARIDSEIQKLQGEIDKLQQQKVALD